MTGLLVKDDLTDLLTSPNCFLESRDTMLIRSGSLKKATVSSNCIVHAVLSGAVKLCLVSTNYFLRVIDLPSDAKMIGLSGLEGSVRQYTSARPSDASRCKGGR